MPKTVKELIRDRYEKLREQIALAQRCIDGNSGTIGRIAQALRDQRLMLDRILEILEAGPQPDARFFWPADKEKLDAELTSFADLSEAYTLLAFSYQKPDMQTACNAFQDYLVAKFADVELINFQQDRHGYENPDRAKHADAIVILVNPADPSEDIIVDFCRASKELGTLYGKLQFLIVGETPW